jgi:hypothetical protein
MDENVLLVGNFVFFIEHLGVKRVGGLKNEWGVGVHRMSQKVRSKKGFGAVLEP